MPFVSQESLLELSIKREGDVQRAVISTTHCRFLEPFESYERHTIGIVVSELGTNIIKYAGEGIIRLQPLEVDGKLGIRIDAIDRGPGILNLDAALKDGYSTGGSLGLGLPAVKRLMDTLDISFPEEGGTHITTTWRAQRLTYKYRNLNKEVQSNSSFIENTLLKSQSTFSEKLLQFKIENFVSPYKGDKICGDLAWTQITDEYLLLVHIDGSGHGHQAFKAASAILTHIQEEIEKWPPKPGEEMLIPLLKSSHLAAMGTVGAAVSIALIDRTSQMLYYIGVGNVTMLLFSPGGWVGIAKSGVIGDRLIKPNIDSIKLNAGESLVSFSDGFSSTGIHKLRRRTDRPREPRKIIDFILESAKDTDDASCVVISWF